VWGQVSLRFAQVIDDERERAAAGAPAARVTGTPRP
jgi:hypothetical protein